MSVFPDKVTIKLPQIKSQTVNLGLWETPEGLAPQAIDGFFVM